VRQSNPLAKSRLLWPVPNAIKEQEEQIERQQVIAFPARFANMNAELGETILGGR